VVADSRVDLARSYVGIAVKAGADHPDIAPRPLCGDAAGRASGPIRGSAPAAFLRATDRSVWKLHPRSNAKGPDRTSGFTWPTARAGGADLALQQISELKQVAGC